MLSTDSYKLRQTHPQLFRGLFLKGLLMIALGMILLVGQERWLIDAKLLEQARVIPLEFWGVLFISIGVTILYGISNGIRRYAYARAALIISASVLGIWAVGWWAAFLQGTVDRIIAPVFFTFVSLTTANWAGEPAFNPLASALNRAGGEIDKRTYRRE